MDVHGRLALYFIISLYLMQHSVLSLPFSQKISTKHDITSTEISYQFSALKVPVWRRNKATNSSTSTYGSIFSCNKNLVLGNLFKFERFSMHSHEHFAIGDNEKNKAIAIFSLIFIPKWQTSSANVMSSLKTLNELLSTRAFSAAEKWTVRSTGVGGCIS